MEQTNRVANRYEDCSAAYRTPGAGHVYIVTALDNDPEPDKQGAFGSAYTSVLRYGPDHEPEGPRNVRLTHDTQASRGLAWDAPRDPWLSTVKTARAGSGPQQVVADPWVTGYRVERREYRRTEDGGWFLPEVEDIWTATMTVGQSGGGTLGYIENSYGGLTPTEFTLSSGRYRVAGLYGGNPLLLTIAPIPPSDALEDWILVLDGDPVGSGSWTVNGLLVTAGKLRLAIEEVGAPSDDLPHSAFEDWVIVVDGRSFPFELPEGVISGNLTVDWANPGLNWANGQRVSIQLVERIVWETLRDETDGDAGTSFTDATDKGDRQYVYRVWPHNDRGLTHYSYRGDWAFNGGDPGGYPVQAPQPQFWQVPQLEGETPSNNPATGHPTIGGTPQVDQTLTADTSNIADQDGLTTVSYNYQWIAGGTDIDGATGASYTLTASEQGQTIQVRVTFTDDADNEETLTSIATAEVTAAAAQANNPATGQPGISGTPQVGETLTADTANIVDQDGLTNATFEYQWIAGGSDIAGATGSTHTLTASEQGKTIQVKVTFTDDADNEETLTSEATAAVTAAPAPVPLTVSVTVSAPVTHDGSSEFTFEIEFSEEVKLSYVTLKNHAFNVTGGSVERAQRTDKPSNISWLITVKPQGSGNVTITLPETTNCGDQRAICTGDGRKLSNSLSFTVSGPGG